VVEVQAVFAIAAEFTFFGEGAEDGLGIPLVFLLAGGPCFVVNALAHLKE